MESSNGLLRDSSFSKLELLFRVPGACSLASSKQMGLEVSVGDPGQYSAEKQ